MQNVEPGFAQLLFEKAEEVLHQPGLTEKERIPKYRSILEELFRQLTSDEKRIFSNFNARIVYITTEYSIPKEIADLTNYLRRFANSVLHEPNFTATETDDARCLYALAETISWFGNTPIPDFLQNRYNKFKDTFREKIYRPRKKVETHSFRAIVKDINVPPEFNGKKYCTVLCDTDEHGTITIKFWDNRKDGFGSDLSEVYRFLWRYCTIYIKGVRPSADRPDEYHANEQTLLVLEPDYLVEAKELAECRQSMGWNPRIHLLGRFIRGKVTDKMMAGIIGGQMLDDLATKPKYAFLDSFTKVMRDNAFGMLCLAHKNGQYDHSKIMGIYADSAALEPAIRHGLQQAAGKQLLIEPTFYSAKYGLHGRLDMLLQAPDDASRKDIVEMKAGTAHNNGLFPNHEAQAVAYSLLLESVFPDRRGLSAILYAKASIAQVPLRAVREESPLLKQQMLLTRNQIVAQEFQLAAGDSVPLERIQPETFGPAPVYVEKDITTFHQTLSGINPLLRAWFLGYVRFIYKELQTAKIGNPANPDDNGGFSALWRNSISEKRDSYSVFRYLRPLEITDDFQITLKIESDNLLTTTISSFREGETALLYPTPDPEILDPLHHQILKCSIVQLAPDRVVVSLANKQLDKQHLKAHKLWALERDFRESGYRTMLQLTYAFLQAPKAQQELLLGLKQPQFEPLPDGAELDGKLNDNQRELAQRALAARNYFLIQGPPGTGKTSTVLIELVRQMVAQGRNLMIIAFTNQAVKVIAEKLEQMGLEFIRLGRGDYANSWSRLSGHMKLNELSDHVAKINVFLSTQASFASSLDLLDIKQFDTLLIDEASQLLEPQLAGLLPRFRRFIMIGDDNQLPAVVQQSEEASTCTDAGLQAIGLYNFRESLFTRLLSNARNKGWSDCFGMLEYHYRMHRDIANFPNRQFYGGLLKTALPEQEAPVNWPSNSHPLHELFEQRVAFVPTQPDIQSKINDEEAQLAVEIIEYVHHLYGTRFNPETTVGVITPFRAQIANIRRRLPEQYQTVTIDTVERFQGSERDVIIVSFAVKNPLQLRGIQSLNAEGVDRKLNVALTRAKEHLVLLGVRETLMASPSLKPLLNAEMMHNMEKAI